MSHRVLILEPNPNLRQSLAAMIQRSAKDMLVYQYDVSRGLPPKSFNWLTYDLLLFDSQLEGSQTLTWLQQVKEMFFQQADTEHFPATVYMVRNPEEGKQALRNDIDDYVQKDKLTRHILMNTLRHALSSMANRQKRRMVEMRDVQGPDIAGYNIKDKIGQGGMSTVYLAETAKSEQRVIKTLYSEYVEDETFVDRFLQEYELMHRLDNPYVVKIYEQSYTEEYMYMVMEYLSAGDLHDRIANGPLAPELALQIIVQIASGLSAIHHRSILHRDLKPSNIMFRADGLPAIIDFGISREMSVSAELTGEHKVMGTLSYMSPEAGQGHHMDERSDIYSLGIMFYEMITGKKPYRGDKPSDVVTQHLRGEIPRLPEHAKEFQAIFEIMIAKNPSNRFTTADFLIDFAVRRYRPLLSAFIERG